MSFVITANWWLDFKRVQSDSTKAVFPDPTGPPMPILRGLPITTGTASHRVTRGACPQFQALVRTSTCRFAFCLVRPPQVSRSGDGGSRGCADRQVAPMA